MNVILVSDHMAKARSITLTWKHGALFTTLLVALVLSFSSLFSYWTVKNAVDLRLPFIDDVLRAFSEEETSKTRELVKENLSAMAVRLGELQGQLMQLNSLGERLSRMAGQSPNAASESAGHKDTPASAGGPLLRPDNLSEADLRQAMDKLARQIDERSLMLSSFEDLIFERRIRKQLLPSARPVSEEIRSSSFGWRKDPITGQTAMHEGVDFIAVRGTPIFAAAAGIVEKVEEHRQYGNVVDISHGNGLVTRYAHTDKILVKQGELVKRGQKIALVGSTGRSTGPHLHFEVRLNDVAQDPARFFAQNDESSLLAHGN